MRFAGQTCDTHRRHRLSAWTPFAEHANAPEANFDQATGLPATWQRAQSLARHAHHGRDFRLRQGDARRFTPSLRAAAAPPAWSAAKAGIPRAAGSVLRQDGGRARILPSFSLANPTIAHDWACDLPQGNECEHYAGGRSTRVFGFAAWFSSLRLHQVPPRARPRA